MACGHSWLGVAVTPVVLISRFTHPTNAASAPYRVIIRHATNRCWEDVRHHSDHNGCLECPRHAGTQHQFECITLITITRRKQAFQTIPDFGPQAISIDNITQSINGRLSQ
jgi:autotransporter strand-loop-strand O-heptosyltransferase